MEARSEGRRDRLDDVFDALSNGQRRAVVKELNQRGDSGLDTFVGPVADRLDASETAVRVQLHSIHLPLLDNAGVVEYDAAECQVETGPVFEPAVRIIDLSEAEPELLG